MSLLQVEHVSKRFGSLLAVDDVSMRVESGELRAVIGPNGAGKTTFFNLITGFFKPDSGHIVLENHDVTNLLPARRVWRGLARTFQITEVFPRLTVRENIQIAVEVASGFRLRLRLSRGQRLEVEARADELLEWSGLARNAARTVGRTQPRRSENRRNHDGSGAEPSSSAARRADRGNGRKGNL